MKEFDYTSVPPTFLHCIHTQCSRADNCLRHNLMQHVIPDRAAIRIVNPTTIPENTENCPQFFPDRKMQFALGITHLLDNIPYSKAKNIRSGIYNYLQRNSYYRTLHKERLITPDEQNFIRQLFLEYEIKEEPQFDRYVEQYKWE